MATPHVYHITALIMLFAGLSVYLPRQSRAASAKWGYGKLDGPHTWGGMCRDGQSQSPIDIVTHEAIPRSYSYFLFDDLYIERIAVEAGNNGHSLVVRPQKRAKLPSLSGGGLADDYRLDHLHFHWGGSEHTFNGKSADLEMHLVHYNAKYNGVAEAMFHKDGLAVIGVLFRKGNNVDEYVEKLLRSALDALDHNQTPDDEEDKETTGTGAADYAAEAEHDEKGEEGDQKDHQRRYVREAGAFTLMEDKISLLGLLPDHIEPWYRYDGSLTTPTCNETVTWTVIDEWSTVSSDILRDLMTLPASDGSVLQYNFRPPQPLHGRTVYRKSNDTSEHRDLIKRYVCLGGSSGSDEVRILLKHDSLQIFNFKSDFR